MRRTQIFLLRAVALLLLCAPGSQATLIEVLGIDTTRGGFLTILEDGLDTQVYAGVIEARYDGTDITPVFCVDLFTNISIDTYESDPILPRFNLNEDRVAWLFKNMIHLVQDPTAGMAIQVAIWDIIHDNGDGANAGRIQAAAATPAAVTVQWLQFLNDSLNQSATGGVRIYENSEISDGTPVQDLIGFAIPEPGTWTLLALGLGAFVLTRTRRRKGAPGGEGSLPTGGRD